MSEKSFNFYIPLNVLSKGDEEWRVGGIASTENKDFQGETIKVDGLDISSLAKNGFFNEDHKKGFQHILGKIDHAEKREAPEIGKHLWVEGKLFKTQPAATAAWNIMNELSKDASNEKKMQLSVEGKILKRAGKDGKVITKAKIENVALTLNPINDNTFATLLKSEQIDEMGVEQEEAQVPSDKVTVTLEKATYDKLKQYAESKKSFKDALLDLCKGKTQAEVDQIFAVIRKAKTGEGSRGGKVIGHTRSGKPIYSNANHADHKDFTKRDHEDAIFAHKKYRKEKLNLIRGDDDKFWHSTEQEEKHFNHVARGLNSSQRDNLRADHRHGIKTQKSDAPAAALTATHSYATQLPQERTGGDVHTSESLDAKKDKRKKKVKDLLAQVKKSYPGADFNTIALIALEKYKKNKED